MASWARVEEMKAYLEPLFAACSAAAGASAASARGEEGCQAAEEPEEGCVAGGNGEDGCWWLKAASPTVEKAARLRRRLRHRRRLRPSKVAAKAVFRLRLRRRRL